MAPKMSAVEKLRARRTPVPSESELPVIPRESNVYTALRVVCFVCFMVWFGISPEIFYSVSPRILSVVMTHWKTSVYESPLPKSLSVSFRLGEICGLGSADNLEEACRLTGMKFLDIQSVCNLAVSFKQHEDHVGIYLRVSRLFNFVNVIWFVSVVGIIVTILPCISAILKKLELVLMGLIKWIRRIVLEIIDRLRNFYFSYLAQFMPSFGYLISFIIIIDGCRLPHEYGPYVSILGSALSCLLIVRDVHHFSHFHHFNHFKDKALVSIISLAIFPTLAVVAMLTSSYLYGFMSILVCYIGLGFLFDSYGLSIIIGFHSSDALFTCVLTSSVLLPVYFLLRRVDELIVFKYGVNVFGLHAYYLGLFIMCSRFCYTRHVSYGASQLWMIVSLLLIGSIASFADDQLAAFNVTVTYIALYLVQKIAELHLWAGGLFFVLLFGLSCLLYVTALYLHANPEFILKMAEM